MATTNPELLDSFLVPSLRGAPAYKINTPEVTVKLDQNETPFDWPDHLKDQVLAKLKQEQWNRYPSAFSGSITELIARYANVPAACVMTGPGTNHLIALFMSALTRQLRGKVVIAQPSFPLYESHCQYEGVPYEVWPLSDNYEYDLELLPEIPEHSLIIFASPNNPTGSVLPKSQLKALLESNPTSFVMADEAYFEFADEIYTDLLASHPNLIILRTCSKTLGAAGLRIGYAIAGKELIADLGKLRLPYLLNKFSIAAAEVFFNSDELQKRVGEHVELITTERETLRQAIASIAPDKLTVFPSSANFLLLRLKDQDTCKSFYTGLINEGVLVRDISRGPNLSGCLRVTVGTREENKKLLEACSKALK